MKQFFKYGFLAVLIHGSIAYSQNNKNPYTLYFGVNAIDSKTSVGGTNSWVSDHFNDFFAADKYWNFFPYSFDFRLSRRISKNVVVGAAVSMNLIDKYANTNSEGRLVVFNPGNLLYYGFDASLTYSFKNFIGSKRLDPAISIGGGYTILGDITYPTINPGGSMTFWISDYFGFEFSTKYKKSFNIRDQYGLPYAPSLFQHSAGIVFKFGKNDEDGDGIADKFDACPQIKGLAIFNGCPDSDNDGLSDKEDNCPEIAGLPFFNGCPDIDGDGVSDNLDACPTLMGLSYLKGCPDADDDGVADKDDECPNIKGLFVLKGCPEKRLDTIAQEKIEIENRAKQIINSNLVYFDTGSTRLSSINVLSYIDSLAFYMKQFDQTKFVIEGHTDNIGTESFNLKLSNDRANAVRNELIKRGVNPDSLEIIGYGYSRPIASNTTEEGRAKNRRIMIIIKP